MKQKFKELLKEHFTQILNVKEYKTVIPLLLMFDDRIRHFYPNHYSLNSQRTNFFHR